MTPLGCSSFRSKCLDGQRRTADAGAILRDAADGVVIPRAAIARLRIAFVAWERSRLTTQASTVVSAGEPCVRGLSVRAVNTATAGESTISPYGEAQRRAHVSALHLADGTQQPSLFMCDCVQEKRVQRNVSMREDTDQGTIRVQNHA